MSSSSFTPISGFTILLTSTNAFTVDTFFSLCSEPFITTSFSFNVTSPTDNFLSILFLLITSIVAVLVSLILGYIVIFTVDGSNLYSTELIEQS